MRRIQIYIDEDLDDALAAESSRRGVSKAALIRGFVRMGFDHVGVDPIDEIIGTGDGEPVDDIDAVVYGS